MLGIVCVYVLYAVERPREVRAVRRALFLPSGEGADGPQGASWNAGSNLVAAPAEQSQVGRGILIAKTSSLLRRIATALGQESAEPSFAYQ